MAEVIIQMSQATLDRLAALAPDGADLPLASVFDAFALAHRSALQVPGAVSYGGVSGQDAASALFLAPGYLQLGYQGDIRLGAGPAEAGAVITNASMQTLLPAASPLYFSDLGNVSLAFAGSVAMSAQGHFQGSVQWLEARAEKFATRAVALGDFSITGDEAAIAQGTGTTQLSGTLRGYSVAYEDNSFVDLRDAAIAVTGSTVMDMHLLHDPALFGGADHFDVVLPGRLAAPWVVSSGAGDDYVRLAGGGGQLAAQLGDGNDVITLADPGHAVDGGDGIDTAGFYCTHTGFALTLAGGTATLHSAEGDDVLTNVERLRFSDENIALDIDGHAGQAYRIYQAAFDRAPDLAGLGYWIHLLDQGRGLAEIAAGFVDSQEFRQLYGVAPSADELAARMYANVLHRVPDQAGLEFWTHILDTHSASTAQVLAAISESPENQAGVAALIGQGIAYIPIAE